MKKIALILFVSLYFLSYGSKAPVVKGEKSRAPASQGSSGPEEIEIEDNNPVLNCSAEDLYDDLFPELTPNILYQTQESNGALSKGLGFYGGRPDSYDGSKLIFTEVVQPNAINPINQMPSSKLYSGHLVLKHLDTNNTTNIRNLSSFSLHNTSSAMWLGNRRVALYEGFNTRASIIDTVTGNILCGGVIDGKLSQNANSGNVLVFQKENGSSYYNQLNLYRCSSGDPDYVFKKPIINASKFEIFKDNMEGSDNIAEWKYDHVQFSPNGRRIALKVKPKNSKFGYIISFDKNGKNLQFFGVNPLHWQWFDNASIFGHDYSVNDGKQNNGNLRRWGLTGNFIETLIENAVDIASAVASKSVNNTSASNVLDSDPDTFWSVDSAGESIKLNLGQTRSFNQLTISFRARKGAIPILSLESSLNGRRWSAVQVLNDLNDKKEQTLKFIPTKAKFLRLTVGGSSLSSWTHITEILMSRHGNHVAMSPDKQWFATESYYHSKLISLYLYKKGDIKPRAILSKHCYDELVWNKEAHVNASFSSDGEKVFFNEAVDEDNFQVFSYDISDAIR